MNTYLRNLSPSHQVGLLFVLIFGLLALISTGAFLVSLKDRHEDDLHTQQLKDFNSLLATSWLMSSVFWIGWTLGETVATVLFGIVAFFALSEFITLSPFKPAQAVAMALIACVAGSLGSLVMKALKRDRGITNWGLEGKSVTGANGLLDRVDALCFAAPIFFHSVRWYFGL